MNPNPHKARASKKQRAKPGDLKAVAAKVWAALERAEQALETEDTLEALKAAHAVFQGATAYAKIYETGELEARLDALEKSAAGNVNVSPLRRAA